MSELEENQETQEIQEVQPPPVQAPVDQPSLKQGWRLRQAREAAGLTRGEVALQMHINERKVAALEEDEHHVFPSATFVSGYLRSYARILGLPEEDFTQPIHATHEPPALVSSVGRQEQASSYDMPVQAVSWGLAALVGISIFLWLLSLRSKDDEVAATANQEPPAAMATAEAAAKPAQEDTTNDEMADGAGNAEAAPMETSIEGDTPVAGTAEAEKTADKPVEEAKPEAPAVQTLVPANPETPTANAEAKPVEGLEVNETMLEEEGLPRPAPLTAKTPQATVVMEYSNDSWTEVDDNAGRRLVYGLIHAGQTIELKGEAPFRVFLGYAYGVRIHYNGELFDHEPFQRGDIARFRIGRVEHNRPVSR